MPRLANQLRTTDLSAVRKAAWETRRAKYGPRGHAGSYARPIRSDALLALVIDLHRGGVLSEGQVAKASGLGRIEVRDLVIKAGGYR